MTIEVLDVCYTWLAAGSKALLPWPVGLPILLVMAYVAIAIKVVLILSSGLDVVSVKPGHTLCASLNGLKVKNFVRICTPCLATAKTENVSYGI